MREGIYSTIRLGAYEPLKRLFGATDPAHTPLWKKICAGAISGRSARRKKEKKVNKAQSLAGSWRLCKCKNDGGSCRIGPLYLNIEYFDWCLFKIQFCLHFYLAKMFKPQTSVKLNHYKIVFNV